MHNGNFKLQRSVSVIVSHCSIAIPDECRFLKAKLSSFRIICVNPKSQFHKKAFEAHKRDE